MTTSAPGSGATQDQYRAEYVVHNENRPRLVMWVPAGLVPPLSLDLTDAHGATWRAFYNPAMQDQP